MSNTEDVVLEHEAGHLILCLCRQETGERHGIG